MIIYLLAKVNTLLDKILHFAASLLGMDVINWLTFYLIETPLNAFANRADPDQVALIRAA